MLKSHAENLSPGGDEAQSERQELLAGSAADRTTAASAAAHQLPLTTVGQSVLGGLLEQQRDAQKDLVAAPKEQLVAATAAAVKGGISGSSGGGDSIRVGNKLELADKAVTALVSSELPKQEWPVATQTVQSMVQALIGWLSPTIDNTSDSNSNSKSHFSPNSWSSSGNQKSYAFSPRSVATAETEPSSSLPSPSLSITFSA